MFFARRNPIIVLFPRSCTCTGKWQLTGLEVVVKDRQNGVLMQIGDAVRFSQDDDLTVPCIGLSAKRWREIAKHLAGSCLSNKSTHSRMCPRARAPSNLPAACLSQAARQTRGLHAITGREPRKGQNMLTLRCDFHSFSEAARLHTTPKLPGGGGSMLLPGSS